MKMGGYESLTSALHGSLFEMLKVEMKGREEWKGSGA